MTSDHTQIRLAQIESPMKTYIVGPTIDRILFVVFVVILAVNILAAVAEFLAWITTE